MPVWYVTPKSLQVGDVLADGRRVVEIKYGTAMSVLVHNYNARSWNEHNPGLAPIPMEPEIPVTWARVTTSGGDNGFQESV
jgi:hypothetical protein